MSEVFGITPTGFNKKRLDTIITELEALFISVYGSNFKVSPETKQGQIIAGVATELSSLWDIAEAAFIAFDPNGATDVSLDRLVQYNNLTRKKATFSTGTITVAGTPNTVIPAGSEVSTSDSNSVFATSAAVTIPAGGSVDVAIQAIETGPITATALTINTIDTPISGWDSVTNATDIIPGANEETNEELRIRRNQSTSINAQNNIDGLKAQLLALDGVKKAIVFDNDTDSTQEGLIAHAGEAIVLGGDNAEIAQTILINKIPGIPYEGNTTETILDEEGIDIDIKFTRPTAVDIVMSIDILTTPNFPSSGVDDIKNNILSYVNGTLIPGREFSVSDDVIFSELYIPINLVGGHQITNLQIAKSGDTLGTANLPIAIREVSNFDTANITINVS